MRPQGDRVGRLEGEGLPRHKESCDRKIECHGPCICRVPFIDLGKNKGSSNISMMLKFYVKIMPKMYVERSNAYAATPAVWIWNI